MAAGPPKMMRGKNCCRSPIVLISTSFKEELGRCMVHPQVGDHHHRPPGFCRTDLPTSSGADFSPVACGTRFESVGQALPSSYSGDWRLAKRGRGESPGRSALFRVGERLLQGISAIGAAEQ